MKVRRLVPLVAGVLAIAAVACGGAPSGAEGTGEGASSAAGGDRIARVHRSRCGACHERVEAGQRTRAQLEDALARHRKRVRLTEDEWAQMVDYLAAH